MSSSEQYGPEVGDPDFWIGEAPEGLDYSNIGGDFHEFDDIEDLVYDRLHDAAQTGSAVYSASDFQDLTDNFVSVDPSEEIGRPDEVGGLMLVDDQGKALYAVKEEHGNTVELDIKIFGDRSGVERYVEDLPTGGYAEGVDTVDGQAFRNATVRAGDHPMDVATETQLSEPGSTVENGFTNAQAERIKNQVLDE